MNLSGEVNICNMPQDGPIRGTAPFLVVDGKVPTRRQILSIPRRPKAGLSFVSPICWLAVPIADCDECPSRVALLHRHILYRGSDGRLYTDCVEMRRVNKMSPSAREHLKSLPSVYVATAASNS
jgi:hypothetical protein